MRTKSPSFSKIVLDASSKFYALSHPCRFAIIHMLQREPLAFDRIVKKLKLSPPLVAHHLKILHTTGWVTRTKFGRLVTYYFSDEMRRFVRRTL